ncbi:MAG: 3-oxoacyl-ACP reductase, partial [Myxococcota bacterium]|nr:3-oxoacyl-ACP reductase [Myxococcota bacterium]
MKFSAIEAVLPSREISNEEVLRHIGEDSESFLSPSELKSTLRLLRFAFKAMGTTVRYRRAEGEEPFELCAEAGRRALDRSGLDASEVDLLVYVGVGR